MGRIAQRDKRYFTIEETIVEVPHPDVAGWARKWRVYSLTLIVDHHRVAASVPLLPRDDETRRAWEGVVEKEVLTALNQERRKPVEHQASITAAIRLIRSRVRREIPAAAVNAYDYKCRALDYFFPVVEEQA